MRKIKFAIYCLILTFVVGTTFFTVNSNRKFVQASETCPEGSGWVKVNVNSLSHTYTPAAGFTVTDNCMKVGDHATVFGTGATVTNTTLFNSPGNLPQGQVCSAPGVPVSGCSLQNISHASFLLVPTTTPSITPSLTPTPTLTPTPSVTPTPTYEPTPTITPTYEPTPDVTPYITPTPTQGQGGFCENNPDAEICIECPGGGTCEVIIGDPTPTPTVTPSVTQAPTVTPTPTSTPQGGATSSNASSSSNSSSSESKNEAASVTAFANTGVFMQNLSNGLLALGTIISAASAALYGKKKKSSKK